MSHHHWPCLLGVLLPPPVPMPQSSLGYQLLPGPTEEPLGQTGCTWAMRPAVHLASSCGGSPGVAARGHKLHSGGTSVLQDHCAKWSDFQSTHQWFAAIETCGHSGERNTTGGRSKGLGEVFKPGQRWCSDEILKGEAGTEQGKKRTLGF